MRTQSMSRHDRVGQVFAGYRIIGCGFYKGKSHALTFPCECVGCGSRATIRAHRLYRRKWSKCPACREESRLVKPCPSCGNEMSRHASRCLDCNTLHRTGKPIRYHEVNVSAVARSLGMVPNHVYRAVARHGLRKALEGFGLNLDDLKKNPAFAPLPKGRFRK